MELFFLAYISKVLPSWNNLFFLSIINQGELGDVQQDLPEHEDFFSLFAGVPQSTPQKSRPSDELPAEFKVPLLLQLTSPAQTVTCTKQVMKLLVVFSSFC